MTDCTHSHDPNAGTHRLLAALGVISVFTIVEVVGGVISGSLALLADAAHMFTDALALGLAASAHFIARKPADAKRHFGYRRAQVLAAFVNGLLLMVLLVWIVAEAVSRYMSPVEIKTTTMLTVAVLGLGANLFAFFILHGHENRSDVNIRGATLHVVNDLLASVAAIIAALVIMGTRWYQIDPILSVLVAALIARSAIKLVRETGHILLEGAPRDIDVPDLVDGIRSVAPEVKDVHDVRIWQLTTDHASLSLHARVADADHAPETLQKIKSYLEEAHGIRQSTIQIEVGDDCPDCGEGEFDAVVSTSVPLRQRGHHRHADESPAAHPAFAQK